jgi:hypothetical protein
MSHVHRCFRSTPVIGCDVGQYLNEEQVSVVACLPTRLRMRCHIGQSDRLALRLHLAVVFGQDRMQRKGGTV